MGNCKSINIIENSIIQDESYLLFESCNESTKERIYKIMDKRIEEAILKDKMNIGFCLKTFFLPNKITEDSFYTFFDVYPSIQTKEKDSDESKEKDIYVSYNIIIERLKNFISYDYTIHHTYWYIQYEHFNEKRYVYTTHEPYQLQNIDGKYYKWHGLIHISKIHKKLEKAPINDVINLIIGQDSN